MKLWNKAWEKGDRWYLLLGHYQITGRFESIEDLLKHIQRQLEGIAAKYGEVEKDAEED